MRTKIYYLCSIFLLTTMLISCTETGVPTQAEDNDLIAKAKEFVISNLTKAKVASSESITGQLVDIKEHKIPFLTIDSQPNSIYMVFSNSRRNPSQLLKQEKIELDNGNVKYFHYLNNKLIGSLTVNKNGQYISSFIASEGKYKETCTGKHYREMMKIIESDGDASFMCNMLGAICHAQVYAAAAAHCFLSH